MSETATGMGRRRAVNADEQDAYSRYWRRYMCWTQRAGRVKAVKRRTHKRERRHARTDLIRGAQ